MSINDPIGDMLTRIRNAQLRGHKVAVSPASKARGWVLDVLEKEGYIRGYSKVEEINNKARFEIELKYFDGSPVIQKIKRVSKPGRRVYSGVDEIPAVRNGLGISILSTSKGIMSDAAAREENVGGEIICQIY